MNKVSNIASKIQWLVEFENNIWILKAHRLPIEVYIVQLSIRAKMSRLIWDPVNRNRWLHEIRHSIITDYFPKIEKDRQIVILEWIRMKFLINLDIEEYDFYTEKLDSIKRI